MNHVVAVYLPPYSISSPKIQASDDAVASSQLSNDVSSSGLKLAVREDKPKNRSCSSCRRKCPRGQILNPQDCRKCNVCPPGLIANMVAKKCIKPEEKKADKEQRYNEKKDEKSLEYKKTEEQKNEKNRRNRGRRMGRCLPLAAIAMGSIVVSEFADNFFDEDYLESLEILSYWPEGFLIDDWISEESDKIFENDAYVETWVAVGNQIDGETVKLGDDYGLGKRNVSSTKSIKPEAERPLEPRTFNSTLQLAPIGSSTTLVVREDNLAKRVFWLIPIFGAVIRVVFAVRNAAAKLSKDSIKIAPKRGKKSRQEQHDGAGKIVQSKNWKNCLAGQKPTK